MVAWTSLNERECEIKETRPRNQWPLLVPGSAAAAVLVSLVLSSSDERLSSSQYPPKYQESYNTVNYSPLN